MPSEEANIWLPLTPGLAGKGDSIWRLCKRKSTFLRDLGPLPRSHQVSAHRHRAPDRLCHPIPTCIVTFLQPSPPSGHSRPYSVLSQSIPTETIPSDLRGLESWRHEPANSEECRSRRPTDLDCLYLQHRLSARPARERSRAPTSTERLCWRCWRRWRCRYRLALWVSRRGRRCTCARC